MQKAKDDGIIRDVKGQSYTTDLTSGDAVLAMAWSGDMPLGDRSTCRSLQVQPRRPRAGCSGPTT